MDEQNVAVTETAAAETAPTGVDSAEFDRFLDHFPQVKAEEIPKEVWQQVASGMSLTGAWAMHENTRLRRELEEHQRREDGRRRTPGSLGGSIPQRDEMDRLWEEED